jgi:Protein of unknown function (DUF2971)
VENLPPIYTVYFSKAFDSLVQWRGYTPPDPSFAVGFNRKCVESGVPGAWVDCAYTQEAGQKAAEEIEATLNRSRDKVYYLDDKGVERTYSSGGAYNAWYRMPQLMQAGILAAQIKHEAFSSEEEVRLIVTAPFGGLPRPAGTFLRSSLPVPFIKVPLRQPIDGSTPSKY